MLANEITKEYLNSMVVRFYTNILKDGTLSPFFVKKFGKDMSSSKWKHHIELLTNFWASIALEDSEYRGNPFSPDRLLMGIDTHTSGQWFKLFYEVVDGLYEPELAEILKERYSVMVGNFMRNLGVVA